MVIIYKIDENSVIEIFYMKFIREILGVHSRITNAPCRTELGGPSLWTRLHFFKHKVLEPYLTSEYKLVFRVYNKFID